MNGPTVSGSFADPTLTDVQFSLLDASLSVLLGPLSATNLGGGNYGASPTYPAGFQYGYARWSSAAAGLSYDFPVNLPAPVPSAPISGTAGGHLVLSLADLRRLIGLDATDTTQDTAIMAVVTSEQPVIEYMLDPAQLVAAATDSGLASTLVLGVEEILAGRYLQQTARAPGALDDFKVGPLTLTASKAPGLVALAQQLAAHGAARLSPWGRAAGAPPAFAAAKSSVAAAALLPTADMLTPAPALDGATGTTTGMGLFGTLQGTAAGSDDGEPPDEFKSNYVSLDDQTQLGDT